MSDDQSLVDKFKDETRRQEIEKMKTEKPSQFSVGGSFDGNKAEGGITYDRKLSNLWGFTAYAKAYWYDQPVIPTDKSGYIIGGDLTKKFGGP